jgi:16S rRNA (uracil1498-N3)-methyltransferase
VETEYAQPHSEKPQRIQAILENACMQAYNPVKPRIRIAASLEAAGFSGQAFFGDLTATTPLTALEPGWPRTFINGPEGGFSATEAEILRARATGVLLSENVLRSDSAAIIALGFLKLRA